MNNNEFQGRNTNTSNALRQNKPENKPENKNFNKFDGRQEVRTENRDASKPSGSQRNWRQDQNFRRDQPQRNVVRDQRDSRDRVWTPNQYPTKRIKTEETIDDIRADLARIEKEIELEIRQISTMRLGL